MRIMTCLDWSRQSVRVTGRAGVSANHVSAAMVSNS
jgi:hypothetical protein